MWRNGGISVPLWIRTLANHPSSESFRSRKSCFRACANRGAAAAGQKTLTPQRRGRGLVRSLVRASGLRGLDQNVWEPLTWANLQAFVEGKGKGKGKGKGRKKGKKGKKPRNPNLRAARRNLNEFLERHPGFVFRPQGDVSQRIQDLWSQLEEDRGNLPRALQTHFPKAPEVLENIIAEMVTAPSATGLVLPRAELVPVVEAGTMADSSKRLADWSNSIHDDDGFDFTDWSEVAGAVDELTSTMSWRKKEAAGECKSAIVVFALFFFGCPFLFVCLFVCAMVQVGGSVCAGSAPNSASLFASRRFLIFIIFVCLWLFAR